MDLLYKYTMENDAVETDILNDWSNTSMPADYEAESRYTLLKEYIAKLQFASFKFVYQITSLDSDGMPNENDSFHIAGAISKLNIIRKNANLIDVRKRTELLNEAKNHLVKNSLGGINDEQRLILLIYILHQENWFNIFALPDEAFVFAEHDNRMDMIGEVYGKYFLYYDYLQNKLKLASPQLSIPVKKALSEKKQKEIDTFKDLFFETYKSKGVYDKVIDALSNPLPYHITSACELPDDTQFIDTSSGKMTWNEGIRGTHMYLAGLYELCKEDKKWIRKVPKLYLPSAKVSFNIGMSRNAFSRMNAGSLDAKYIKPFQLLFRHI